MVDTKDTKADEGHEGHEALMRCALFHAARGQGRTTPNPMVGAVIVSPDRVVLGHGWHERAGEAHAEINALADAGGRARGATIYVTLEPCCHYGRTGPCTRALIEAGISRVVAATSDPNPLVRGQGFAELRAHDIEVIEGVCEEEARRLNQAFFTIKIKHRPLVLLKAATSLNARIAEPGDTRTLLTGEEANRRTHILRASVDAVAVGSSTVLADDPLLTARYACRVRPLVRAVFDRRLRITPDARLFSTLDHGPVIILTSEAAFANRAQVSALEAVGGEVVAAETLHEALRYLADRDVSTLLVEGGAVLHEAFCDADLVDRVHLIVAPRVLADEGVKLFNGRQLRPGWLRYVTVEPRGADIWMEADVHRHS